MRSPLAFLPSSYWLRTGLVVSSAVVVALVWSAYRNGTAEDLQATIAAGSQPVYIDVETERKIISFCSACHAMPLAASFARDEWHAEVMQGYHFHAKSGRTDLEPPAPYLTISYFQSHAPQTIVLPPQVDDGTGEHITFRAERFPLNKSIPIPPSVAHLKWLPGADQVPGFIVACDMGRGTVSKINPKSGLTIQTTPDIGYPCHAEPCDLNRDGVSDLVIADLGSFLPDDHDRGRVVWMRGDSPGKWTVEPLAEKLGRVSDVRPVDLDRDGDLDLVVAEFGWHATGGILVLRNRASGGPTRKGGAPEFQSERVYSRPGTIHVPCEDMDGDGLPDIVALVSQEHERVELLLNRGQKPWEVQTLWSAPDPAFGLSGMELVDLDRDGDSDILFTNGDTFDSLTIKPSHGIQWLRNDGQLRFTYQRIADLSGVYRAAAADFDLDGDLDVIAAVFMPGSDEGAAPVVSPHPALVLFEQVAPLKFTRKTLQRGHPRYVTLEVGDFDGDGDPDIIVSPHLTKFEQSHEGTVVWWNESRRSGGR